MRRTDRFRLSCLAVAAALGGLSACSHLPMLGRRDRMPPQEHMSRGAAYEKKGMPSYAAKEYEAAMRKDKNYVPALVALGNQAFRDGNLIDAEVFYRRALRLHPGHPGANNNMAAVYLARGDRLEKAELLAQAALVQAGTLRPYVLDTLANIYMRQGRFQQAKAALDEAEGGLRPGNVALRDHLVKSRQVLESSIKASSLR